MFPSYRRLFGPLGAAHISVAATVALFALAVAGSRAGSGWGDLGPVAIGRPVGLSVGVPLAAVAYLVCSAVVHLEWGWRLRRQWFLPPGLPVLVAGHLAVGGVASYVIFRGERSQVLRAQVELCVAALLVGSILCLVIALITWLAAPRTKRSGPLPVAGWRWMHAVAATGVVAIMVYVEQAAAR